MNALGQHRASSGRRGFTLIEVMIAVALTGLLLVGLNFFVFSMGDLWGRSGDRRMLDAHVQAVTRYLEKELRTAGLPPAAVKGDTPFLPADVRPSGGMSDTLFTFVLPAGGRLFTWPARPLPEVVCALQVRQDRGLFLLWHSRLEKRFLDDPPREVLVSPYVTALTFDYYDPDMKRWTTETQFKKDSGGAYLTPQRLRFKFAYGGYTEERVIVLPQVMEGVPNY